MANTKPIGVAYEDQNIIGADIVEATDIVTTGTIGYAASAFGTVTQTNNKTTAVVSEDRTRIPGSSDILSSL